VCCFNSDASGCLLNHTFPGPVVVERFCGEMITYWTAGVPFAVARCSDAVVRAPVDARLSVSPPLHRPCGTGSVAASFPYWSQSLTRSFLPARPLTIQPAGVKERTCSVLPMNMDLIRLLNVRAARSWCKLTLMIGYYCRMCRECAPKGKGKTDRKDVVEEQFHVL
jgi:hypothetical protein